MYNLTVSRVTKTLVALELIIFPLSEYLIYNDVFLGIELQKIGENLPSRFSNILSNIFSSLSLNEIYSFIFALGIIYTIKFISLIGLFFSKVWAKVTITVYFATVEILAPILLSIFFPETPFISSYADVLPSDIECALMGAIITIIWLSPKLVASKASIKE